MQKATRSKQRLTCHHRQIQQRDPQTRPRMGHTLMGRYSHRGAAEESIRKDRDPEAITPRSPHHCALGDATFSLGTEKVAKKKLQLSFWGQIQIRPSPGGQPPKHAFAALRLFWGQIKGKARSCVKGAAHPGLFRACAAPLTTNRDFALDPFPRAAPGRASTLKRARRLAHPDLRSHH